MGRGIGGVHPVDNREILDVRHMVEDRAVLTERDVFEVEVVHVLVPWILSSRRRR